MIEGLRGPQGAFQRMQEIQARIASLTPPPTPTNLAPVAGDFASTLGNCMPADPTQFDIQGVGNLKSMAAAAAQKNGVDPAIFQSLVNAESGWNPSSQSNKGAQGLTQLMPSTAASLGVTNPLDPAQSLEGGAKYLRQMLDMFGNDYTKAVAAYNAGPGAVQRANGIPPYQETIAYVKKVLGGANSTL